LASVECAASSYRRFLWPLNLDVGFESNRKEKAETQMLTESMSPAAPITAMSVGLGGAWPWFGLRQGGASPAPVVAVGGWKKQDTNICWHVCDVACIATSLGGSFRWHLGSSNGRKDPYAGQVRSPSPPPPLLFL
jgi:hypothetical protein